MGNKHGSKWIRPERRQAIYERDGWRCLWCQAPLGDIFVGSGERTLDHLLPRSITRHDGRADHRSCNLVTACVKCNNERGDRNAIEYAYTKPNPVEILDRIVCLTGRPVQGTLPGLHTKPGPKRSTPGTLSVVSGNSPPQRKQSRRSSV